MGCPLKSYVLSTYDKYNRGGVEEFIHFVTYSLVTNILADLGPNDLHISNKPVITPVGHY